MFLLKTFWICLGALLPPGYADVVHVTSPQGDITGTLDSTTTSPVIKFYGIPFAQPPIGDLRFKAPQPPSKWTGSRDATRPGQKCMQGRSGGNSNISEMSEDCLYLNIYVPTDNNSHTVSSSNKLPVMVWIHGGGYIYGSGVQYDGTELALNKVVVVTVNYRLDMFGFLSTQDDILPGNYGMLDQIAALQWVQTNIGYFGGDSSAVTIFGESAGSSSVSLLVLSPLSKGLFTRAIMESGAATSPWGFQHPGNRVSPRMTARLLATALSCTDLDDSVKLLGCLQAVDAGALMNTSVALSATLDSNYVIGPRVETTFGFLPELPEKILSKGSFNHVDTIQGYNTDESALWAIGLSGVLKRNKTDEEKADMMAQFWLKQLTNRDRHKMFEYIKNKYLSPQANAIDLFRNALQSQDDMAFEGPIRLQLNNFVSKAPQNNHFLYKFNHRPGGSRYPTWVSASHGEELLYVFGPKVWNAIGNKFNDLDEKVHKDVSRMWTNFAKSGYPINDSSRNNATWKPYQLGMFHYLEINVQSQEKTFPNGPDPVFDTATKFLAILDGAGK